MRFIAHALLAVASAILPLNAFATDGNKLLTDCKAANSIQDTGNDPSRNFLGVGYCLGRIEGISVMNFILLEKGSNSAMFCKPKGVTIGQMTRIVVRYLEEHPEKLHIDPSFLIVLALGDAYPCKDER